MEQGSCNLRAGTSFEVRGKRVYTIHPKVDPELGHWLVTWAHRRWPASRENHLPAFTRCAEGLMGPGPRGQ